MGKLMSTGPTPCSPFQMLNKTQSAHPYYLPLASDEVTSLTVKKRSVWRSRLTALLLVISVAFNCILTFVICGISMPHPDNLPVVYSPAHDVVKVETKVFDRGLQSEMPIYEQFPSKEVDEAWDELTKYGFSKITRDEARQMANRTHPIAHDNEYYMSGLDVFHQLHCLDMLRMTLYPAAYPSMSPTTSPMRLAHLAHCVGHVRQALMCAADVTPIVWQWDAEGGMVRRRDDVPHTCKNFESIKEWAKERWEYVDDEEMKVHVEGDGL